MNLLADSIGDFFALWQLIPLVGMVGLIVFWVWYRKRQM